VGRGAAHAEEKEEGRAGPRVRERRGVWAGWVVLFSFLFFSFPNSIPIQTIYLNSNKFEFKPYKFNTRKTMLQHECTNILIL
jgi:hypothetical protein